MGINIKNEETVRLIRELAELTGEGQTAAVTEAVRERIERLSHKSERERRLERILAISRETAPLMRDFDMDEALYGENGLYDRETGLPK
ncbi:MAG: type II toxin-antitoxin system VapB family antitoxin [Bauldia sp.]|uniref:type II toxin-antitoxin system VapB family antitoxin n=1 Tax=Bauldia sp. TaxID=2575872 RepID=UPI001DF2845C|nr:type II toxin-antitoxin system VapB family antitoxin [Bauldia sp.]MCB1495207.1 type II toxin-antitoxin system VapB family antitoxin [Bauldia sp.]